MIKISEATRAIITESPFLEFGISYDLFNLTALAKFIEPLVEARTKKDVQPSAIVMSLSRFQREKKKITPKDGNFWVRHIAIHPDLCTLTFANTPEAHENIQSAYNEIKRKNGYFAISESTKEITIFCETQDIQVAEVGISESPKYKNTNIACIRVEFEEKYFHIPGLLFSLMQKLSLQGINLIEISSTYTEFNFFIDQKDIKLSFQTLYDCFVRK